MAIQEKGLISYKNPNSIISEQYRTIRTNLFYSSTEKKYRSIVITSTDYGDGKTTIIANLAISIVYQGAKVLVVDSDLRNPSVHNIFSIENSIGLANVLLGQEDIENVVRKTEIDNLDIITSGSVSFNPADLLTSSSLDELIEKTKKNYDVIIFDSPPVLKVTDGRILANKCDGTIIVITNEKTKAEDAVESKRLLELAKANVIGVIFNKK